MTPEEFVDKYIEEDLVSRYEEIRDFFAKDIPDDFKTDYDVGEVILDTIDQNLFNKQIENIIEFAEILRTKQPEIYSVLFPYIDDFLVDIYCYRGDHVNTHKAFRLFVEHPLRDFDKYLLKFKQIIFNQESELVEKAVTKTFETVDNSEDILPGAEHDFSISMFYIKLQEIFENEGKSFNKSEFSSLLSAYSLNLQAHILDSLETGLLKSHYDSADLKNLYKKKRKKAIAIIQAYYLRYMYDKGFPFYLSGQIWDKMSFFWERKNTSNKSIESYFELDSKKFAEQIMGLASNIFSDCTSEMIAILWGSVYTYDFLEEYNIISRETFDDFKETSKILKGKIIAEHTADLWSANFVHNWKKADSISETEFVEEKKLFEKSLNIKRQPFSSLRSIISEELTNIGELSHYIIEGTESDDDNLDDDNLDDDNLDDDNDLFEEPDIEGIAEEVLEEEVGNLESERSASPRFVPKPTQNGKKVGRNDPCPCGSGKKYKKCCGKN